MHCGGQHATCPLPRAQDLIVSPLNKVIFIDPTILKICLEHSIELAEPN
jgi:hypothetical protein